MVKIFLEDTFVHLHFYRPLLFLPWQIVGSFWFGVNVEDWRDDQQQQEYSKRSFMWIKKLTKFLHHGSRFQL